MSGSDEFFGRIKDNWRQRAHERLTFGSEFRLIPRWLVFLVMWLYILAVVITAYVTHTAPEALPNPVLELVGRSKPLQFLAMFGIVTAIAIPVACYIFLIGYINRDAKRRGMSPALWTVIAIFVPYLVGAILYFVIREPLPFHCPGCGTLVNTRFNYCPSCQYNLRPNCPQCRREIRFGDHFCPHCGFGLESGAPAASLQSGAQAAG